MADSLEISTGHTGPTAPNQPMQGGLEPNESEASQERQTEQTPSEQQYEVPDKFMLEDGTVDVEAMAKSYMELEKGYSKNTEETQETGEVENNFPLSDDEMAAYGQELMQNGSLSEESFSAMEARGLPRAIIEQYIQGQQALVNQNQAQFLETVGGQENYDALADWASDNLSEAEITAYDNTMNTGDPNQIQMAIQGLFARYQQATNRPTLLKGDTGTSGASQAFRSWAEVTAAMKDPKYQNDPSYRQDIQNRLSVSNLNS
jgi:hypothetical protein